MPELPCALSSTINPLTSTCEPAQGLGCWSRRLFGAASGSSVRGESWRIPSRKPDRSYESIGGRDAAAAFVSKHTEP
eukprot:COSAG06_NODE_50006_length_321_cov_1.153153_1_plen_76_part_10